MSVIIKAPFEIDAMRIACQATARVMGEILPDHPCRYGNLSH